MDGNEPKLDAIKVDIIKSYGSNEHYSWDKSNTSNIENVVEELWINYFNDECNIESNDEIYPLVCAFMENKHASNLTFSLVGDFDRVRQGVKVTIRKMFSC